MDDGHGIKACSPSDEGGSAEPPHGAGGSIRRPYYECTFCKRGFSNAQALGGHMNIHRRDRRPPASPSLMVRAGAVVAEEAADGYGSYCCDRYADGYGAAAAVAAFYQPAAYAVCLPASAAGCGGRQSTAGAWAEGGSRAAPYEMSLFGGEELRLGLSAGRDQPRRQEVQEEGELDLELRLGHRP